MYTHIYSPELGEHPRHRRRLGGYPANMGVPTPTLVVKNSFGLRVLLWFLWGVCPCVYRDP